MFEPLCAHHRNQGFGRKKPGVSAGLLLFGRAAGAERTVKVNQGLRFTRPIVLNYIKEANFRPNVEVNDRMNSIDLLVGSRIRFRRLMLGVHAEALAALIGVSCQQMERFESGEDRVAAPLLVSLAKLLRVNVAYFFASHGSPDPERDELLARDALELHRAFIRIRDPEARRKVIDLAISLSPETGNI